MDSTGIRVRFGAGVRVGPSGSQTLDQVRVRVQVQVRLTVRVKKHSYVNGT